MYRLPSPIFAIRWIRCFIALPQLFHTFGKFSNLLARLSGKLALIQENANQCMIDVFDTLFDTKSVVPKISSCALIGRCLRMFFIRVCACFVCATALETCVNACGRRHFRRLRAVRVTQSSLHSSSPLVSYASERVGGMKRPIFHTQTALATKRMRYAAHVISASTNQVMLTSRPLIMVHDATGNDHHYDE